MEVKMSPQPKNAEYYVWLRTAIAALTVFQIIIMFDTFVKMPKPERSDSSTSALRRINGEIISVAPRKIVDYVPDVDGVDGIDDDDDADHDDDDDINSRSNNDFGGGEDEIVATKDTTMASETRQVFWLDELQFDSHKSDYYSGSWYLPVERLDAAPAEKINNLESASHVAFYPNSKHARMSVDWLDFSVEHLSRWIKSFDMFAKHHNDIAVNRLVANLEKYIQDTPERTKALLSASESERPLLHPTLAVIAASSLLDNRSDVSIERSRKATAAMLGATIASMLRAGFGRIILTVVNEEDLRAVRESLDLIGKQYADRQDWITDTELGYVFVDEELYKTPLVPFNRPKAAVYGIQQALNGNFNASYTEEWLGKTNKPDYWKYVYFTENDLILQTRPASLPGIHNELEQGHALFPHRLEAVPHKLDVTDENGKVYNQDRFLPADGKFSNIMDLDADKDMCCDGSNDRPSWKKEDDPPEKHCYSWWWQCGYTREWKELDISDEVKHRRILNYAPFIRLNQGTNIISISGSEHERKCHPRKRLTPSDICEQPQYPE